jgi:hypothetical protein
MQGLFFFFVVAGVPQAAKKERRGGRAGRSGLLVSSKAFGFFLIAHIIFSLKPKRA